MEILRALRMTVINTPKLFLDSRLDKRRVIDRHFVGRFPADHDRFALGIGDERIAVAAGGELSMLAGPTFLGSSFVGR